MTVTNINQSHILDFTNPIKRKQYDNMRLY